VNSEQAKKVLLLYRPGTTDDQEPGVAEALECVRHDTALQTWFDHHCRTQLAIQRKLRQIEPPAHLRIQLLAQSRVVRPPSWNRPAVWLAAAAALTLLLGGLAFWSRLPRADRFADYESRMVRTVLREYRMDLITSDMQRLRGFLDTHGAPSNYELPPGLANLPLTGGGRLLWRNQPVSMVCFNRGDQQMLFLFVISRSAVRDPPPETPQTARFKRMITACWSRGDKVYLLAGLGNAGISLSYQ
jgi:hypothetical protein